MGQSGSRRRLLADAAVEGSGTAIQTKHGFASALVMLAGVSWS